MQLPPAALADWRAKVEKELAGKSFEKALVQETPEGIAVQPSYIEAPASLPVRDSAAQPFRICIRRDSQTSIESLVAEVEEGADALWLDSATPELRARPELAKTFFVFESTAGFLKEPRTANTVLVSTLPLHDAGADAVDELACALSSAAGSFRALMEAGHSAEHAARQVWVRVAVGRDTFLELCKLRALRTVWRKLLTALGAPDAPRALVHAVCSSRTLSERDPWVNMLRVTTQTFAAILGGADLVTPNAFDQALGEPSAQGRRVARNTGLVLREESQLGKVADPAGGSYAFETLTDQLARKAWQRFQELEREGGIAAALESGALAKRFEAAWTERLAAIAKRKTPILGVSEFANLDEKLPQPAPQPAAASGPLAAHRDAAVFEELRWRAESRSPAPAAALVTLGEFSESRARVGFATSFFAAGGIRSRETTANEAAPIACLCGTDERYAVEAAEKIRALKAAGCGRVLVAGRPGPLEKSLKEAGADGFIYVGCDAVAILGSLLS